MDQNKEIPFFLALLNDSPDEPDDYTFSVYFVNNTDREAGSVRVRGIEHWPADEGSVASAPSFGEFTGIKARSFVRIDRECEWGFDNAVSYTVAIRSMSGAIEKKLRFDRPKYLSNREEEMIPVLNKMGFVVKPEVSTCFFLQPDGSPCGGEAIYYSRDKYVPVCERHRGENDRDLIEDF